MVNHVSNSWDDPPRLGWMWPGSHWHPRSGGPHPKCIGYLDLAYLQGKNMAAMHVPFKFNSSTDIPLKHRNLLCRFWLEHARTLATKEARAQPRCLQNPMLLGVSNRFVEAIKHQPLMQIALIWASLRLYKFSSAAFVKSLLLCRISKEQIRFRL